MTETRPDSSEQTPLDPGLRRAFQGRSRFAASKRTDGPADEAPLFANRYRQKEVLGRGGMGVVWLAYDIQLERDLALKLLRAEFGGSPERCRRFVEEAKIAGRLQHPGIVPVYDRGVTDEGEPYFTMRLVQGETLKARLDAWREDQTHRRRLLPVLVRVTEAVAAAHAQGVIHRDLKPSNIMLGSLGEVLVMDFGLAKLLEAERFAPDAPRGPSAVQPSGPGEGGDATLAGAVLGTPHYMAPEQAAGDVMRIGPPADVHALGAILLEILVGTPYLAASQSPASPASAEDLSSRRRDQLHQSSAEPGLIQITLSCLHADPELRPKDAGELLQLLAKHSADEEDRRRLSELELATAAAQASSERRSRRLATALFSVLAVVGTAGVWAWRVGERRHAEEVTTTNRRAEHAWTRVKIADARATAEPTPALIAWREAMVALEGAEAYWQAPLVDPELAERGHALADHVRRCVRAAAAKAAEREREENLVHRLDRIRAWYADLRDRGDDDLAYAAAFREFGFDVDAMDPAELIAQIQASPLRARLADALLDWARARFFTPAREGPRGTDFLVRLVSELTVAPPLRVVFELIAHRKYREAIDAAEQLDLTGLPSTPLVYLGDFMFMANMPERSVAFLRRVVAAHPGSVEALGSLAYALERVGTPAGFRESARCVMAASALLPTSNYLRACVGNYLHRSGDVEAAARWFDHQEALIQDDQFFQHFRGIFAMSRRDLAKAESCFRRVLQIEPGWRQTRANLGLLLVDRGQIEEGETHLRILDAKPLPEASLALASLCAERGEFAEAEFQFLLAAKLAPESPEPPLAYGRFLAQTYMSGHAVRELERGMRLATPKRRESVDGVEAGIAVCQRETARIAAIAQDLERAFEQVEDEGMWRRLARHFQESNDPSEEARVWAEAFASTDSWLDFGLERAAEAAALAAARAPNLTMAQEFRATALRYLQREEARLASPSFDPASARRRRAYWLKNSIFAHLRGAEPDATSPHRLSAEEAVAWTAFFARVRPRV